MADVTSICNQALAAIGTRTTITSIGEASNEARQCLLQYDPTRKHLLRSAHWGFSRGYNAVGVLRARFGTPENPGPPPIPNYIWESGYEPPPPWLYTYMLPSDCLAVRYIVPAIATGVSTTPPIFGTQSSTFYPDSWMGPMIKFEIVNDRVPPSGQYVQAMVTNMPKAIICYTRDVEDVTVFDESFTRAFVQALASNLCQGLTGDLKLLDALIKMTNNLILEARVKNANEGLTAIDVMPDWFRVRGLGPSVGTGPWVAEYGPLFGGVS